jgi:hypothetical protein
MVVPSMSWYPTQTNALYVTEDLEPKSSEYIDSQGRHFIDVDDVVVDHKTVNGYITVDEDSGLPIYNAEPQEETIDTRVKDSWSSIVDRFSVHDLMNMHYEIDIVYPTKKVLYHDSIYLLYANQVNSAKAAELRKSWLANIKEYTTPYVNSNGVAIGSHKVSQDIAEKWGLVVA